MKPQLCCSIVQHAFRLAHLALLTICVFVAFAALSAVAATPEWTGTAWTSPVTPAADNILSPAYLAGSTYNDVAFCDHVYDMNIQFAGRHDVIWNLPGPATVSAVNIYGGWRDTGRADIYVTSVSVKYSTDGEWVVLDNSSANFYCTQLGKQIKAQYAMTDGSTLASGVVALKITFPSQQNGGVGIYEIELCGAFDEPLAPEVFPYTFDFGNYNPATWTPSAENMMGLCTSMKKDSGDITASYAFMIDGSVAASTSFQISPGNLVIWNFSKAFTLDVFKVFSRWNDIGRDAIVIYNFEVKDGNDVWHALFDATHPVILGTTSSADLFTASGGAKGGTGHLWFSLARGDGEPLATDVTAIRVKAGYAMGEGGAGKWNAPCWSEVEAIGSTGGGEAVLENGSVTVANDCWEVVWSAKLSSLGASDSATINLWTSTDNETFTLADSRTATEVNTAYWFTNVFDSVGMTIWYKFETVNTGGAGECRMTNEVASVVNHDNATYWWRGDVTSGAWENGGCWSNSHNDVRLLYPDGGYATADFSLVDTSRPVSVSVSAAHSAKLVWPPSAATLTFTGTAPAAIADTSASANVSGTNTFDGVSLTLPKATFADYSRLRLAGGSVAALGANSKLMGRRCGIELSGGASISFGSGPYNDFCNDAEIILNGGTVSNAGYFTWSGSASKIAGHIVFGPESGEFISPVTHRFMNTVTTPLELRYELPGRDWRGYARAPLRLGFVNSDHYFGGNNGKVFVNVVKGMAQAPSRACRIKLIDTTHSNANIITNGFTFAAFGEALVAGETSSKGEKFLWTYDHGDSLEPATPGSRPTGLVFDYAGRRDGLVILLK